VTGRRVYYDHESVYREVAARGGAGWDDRSPEPDTDSYDGLDAFIESYCGGRRLGAVLDLGCGGGQAALRFVDLADRIVGTDYSETAITLARKNAAAVPSAEFVVGDITRLDTFEPGFDVIVDNHALHCLVDDAHRLGMLSGVARILREDGLFFSETMSREGRFDADTMGASAPIFADRAKKRRWVSMTELASEFREAGLEIVEQRRRALREDEPPFGDLLWTVARRRT